MAIDQVGWPHRCRVGSGGAPGLAAALGALDALAAHQPLHPVAPDPDALTLELKPGAPVAVTVPVGGVSTPDLLEPPLVLDGPARPPAALAVVVGRRRHAQDPADRLDAEAAAMLVDEAAHFGRSASSSVAKNTDAALRISFARRNS